MTKKTQIVNLTVDKQPDFLYSSSRDFSVVKEQAQSHGERWKLFQLFIDVGCSTFGDVVQAIVKGVFDDQTLSQIANFQEDGYIMPPLIAQAAKIKLALKQ